MPKVLKAVCLASAMVAMQGCVQVNVPDVAASTASNATLTLPEPGVAEFDYFEYSGKDAVFDLPKTEQQYRNPIISGFHPDPSVVRVEDDYYLVNSTFGFFPGVPIFHSKDLVNWKQIGNVIDRPDMMNFKGMSLGWNGIYAPTIEYHEGTFYVITTCVLCGGNFIVTSKDPAGPWSDPSWLPEVGEIDPSLYFEDGRVWIVNHDGPAGEALYEGHKGIWIREVDPVTFQPITEQINIVDGGSNIEEKPWYVEGPHIYKVDGRYILSAAEGGTEEGHSQVVFESDNVMGPYTPNPNNPIITQRHLPADRPNPVNSTGHVDIFQIQDGSWWAVFLATRPYKDIHLNTGRETFLLPVEWKDGWPVILSGDEVVPYIHARPDLPITEKHSVPITGNFTIREEFDGDKLDFRWLFARAPETKWWQIDDGALKIRARSELLGDQMGQPSFVGQRQKHANIVAETSVRFVPGVPSDEAGLAAVLNDSAYFTLGLGKNGAGETVVRARGRSGSSNPISGILLAEAPVNVADGAPVKLKFDFKGDKANFLYSTNGQDYQTLITGEDLVKLSARYTEDGSGGFVGVIVGMYAQSAGDE